MIQVENFIVEYVDKDWILFETKLVRFNRTTLEPWIKMVFYQQTNQVNINVKPLVFVGSQYRHFPLEFNTTIDEIIERNLFDFGTFFVECTKPPITSVKSVKLNVRYDFKKLICF